MRRQGARIGVLWLVLIGAALVSLVVFAVLLGPKRALGIAAASVLSTAVDGFAEDPGPHRIPVIDVRVDPTELDTLNADLPWSGDHNVPAVLVQNGVRYKVKFRYRGVYSPSHYLGDKKSFRLTLKRSGPFAPYRKVNVIVPKSLNLLNNYLGNWIAGSMGVAVPYDEMVFVRLNQRDLGVMEMFEQIDGGFEQARGVAADDVPVYRGEFPPVMERKLPENRQLWRSAAHWEYTSDADSTIAHARLQALVAVIGSATMDLDARRDSLAKLIDVDAYLRYMAAILVVNTKHMDQYHNQWLVMRHDGRFYPVWWDALLMFAPEGEPLYFIHDALAFWILQVPEWRLQRDRYAWEALRALHGTQAFTQKLDRTIQRVMPSVLADRNKYGNVTFAPEDVHRNSIVHVIGSLANMRSSVAAYWDRTTARLRANDVTVVRKDSVLIHSNSEAAIRLSWIEGESESKEIYVNGEYRDPEWNGKEYTLVLHRDVKLPEGAWNRPFVDWQHFLVEPLDATIRFPRGIPAGLRITNAITDEAIPERRIGIVRWLLVAGIAGGLLVAVFSLVTPSILEGEWPLGISAREVSRYAGLFDRRPQEGTNALPESYHIGGSRKDGACLLDHTGPGWSERWFEADGYGDSVEVRRLRSEEGGFIIKFDREEPFHKQRQVVLIPAGSESIRAKYLEILATELGLVTPEVSFVRVIACGTDLGLYLKEERIGPEFMEKNKMADAALFSQGFDPQRPDQLMPAFEDDTLAARTMRSTLQQVYANLEKGRTDALPYVVDEKAAIGWLLMRWLEGNGDPFSEEGLFAYRWMTGRIVPLYRRSRGGAGTWADTTAPVSFNVMSALLLRPSFRAAFSARREKLIEEFGRSKERFTAADAAWLPILVGSKPLGPAQARAAALVEEMRLRLNTDPLHALDRIMVPGGGYRTLVQPEGPARYWPTADDEDLLHRIGIRLKAQLLGDTIVFPRGRYAIDEDLIIPYGYTVVLEQGARFEIAPGRSMLCLGPLIVRGTLRNPVFVRAQQEGAPFGTFAVSCREGDRCSISGLLISGGSEARINGEYHSGMFSIRGASNTTLSDCVVSGSAGEDAFNIKGGAVVLENCVFEDGHADLVDLDFVTGEVRDCVFRSGREDSNGDGLDVSGSHLLVEDCRMVRMMDKGLSSGEASQVLVRNNRFEGNRLAIASKDLSVVYVQDNTFTDNAVVFGVYRKKPIYGGAHLMLGINVYEGNVKDRDVDALSEIVPQDSLKAEVLKAFGAR